MLVELTHVKNKNFTPHNDAAKMVLFTCRFGKAQKVGFRLTNGS